MTFFLDLWQDLREKRLWPVAVGLLAAAIAIPVVMLKPASDGSSAPVAIAPAPKTETLPAVDVSTSPTRNSNLKTFKQRDPFKPLSELKKSNTDSSSASSAGSSGSSSSSGASGAGSSSPSSSTPITTPLTSPSTPRSSSDTSTTTTTPVKWFRYTADISFGVDGSEKTMKSVENFTLLPDDKTAAIVFMGVSNDAKSAIFFIADPAFTPSGEGECNDTQDCRFVKLALDDKKNEETFTSLDGSIVYKLKLLKLNREFMSADQAQGDATGKAIAPKLGKPAGETITDASQAALPRLLDLGNVASEQSKTK
jgi:hypothetical protein